MKKALKMTATLIAILLLICGCTPSQSNNGIVVTTSLEGKNALVGNIPCSFPLVTDDTELTVLSTSYNGVDFNNLFVWNKYEEMTGVNVNWTNITKSERSETVYTVLTNNQPYDLIMRCKPSASTLTQYGENGLILDLAKDDLLKTYAPNCWAYLQSHPDTLASIMNPDGAIYSLPQVNSGAELRVARKIFINKSWLEAVNMNIPTTTTEFYDMLVAFSKQDMNNNGDTTDEIPLCSLDWLSIQESFYGAFGLANRGQHNLVVDCDEATGNVRLIAADDSYRDFLQYFAKLYSEGLMDANTFNMTSEQWNANISNDRIGVFANTNLAGLPADESDNWVAIEEALEGPNGDKLWTAIRANFHSTGAAVIPATCTNPELVLKWLDYFWTDEGTLFFHMGIEGETFVANTDGTYNYTDAIYNEIGGDNTFDSVVSAYTPYPGGSNPTVEIAPYFMGGEMADIPAAAARALFEYGPTEYWPSFTFTTEENNKLDVIQTDIVKFCTSAQIDFITGEKDFEDWDKYIEQLDKLKMSEMLAIYQAALTRYTDIMAASKK